MQKTRRLIIKENLDFLYDNPLVGFLECKCVPTKIQKILNKTERVIKYIRLPRKLKKQLKKEGKIKSKF